MYKLITLATLLLGLALAPVLRGSVAEDKLDPMQTDWPRDNDRVTDRVLDHAGQSDDAATEVETSACEWRCEACEPGQACSQICTEIGNCGSTCDMVARCNAEFVWDETSCSCVG